jgi:hypothetical protein
MASKNECAKTRPIEAPYEVWQAGSSWEWRVLKKYQSPEKEEANPYARWFCAVASPFVDDYEYGDCYVKDITGSAVKVS